MSWEETFKIMNNKIKDRLLKLHEEEDVMNVEMGKIDKQIKLLGKRKSKLSKRISENMKFRNRLINQLK
jgi:hypothetical protein